METSPQKFSIKFQNFRAIEIFDWEPDGVNLLIGANGSGKTTVLDALLFIRTLFERGQKAAFSLVESEYFRRSSASKYEPVLFELWFGKTLWVARFSVAGNDLGWELDEELYHEDKLVMYSESYHKVWFLNGITHDLADNDGNCCAKVLWEQGSFPWMNDFVNSIKKIAVHKKPPVKDPSWKTLHAWKSSNDARFKWVTEKLKSALPRTFESLDPGFCGEKPFFFSPGSTQGLPPSVMDDGTRILTFILTTVSNTPRNGVVAFDGMLDNVHPSAIRHLVGSIRETAEENGSTVILTTHSPVVLNTFNHENDHVFVMGTKNKTPSSLNHLHNEDWLAQERLGTLYDNLRIGSPEDTISTR